MAKKPTKSTSPPKGRPEAEIDWALVDEMLKAQCPGTEIAEAHGIHPNTLYLACERENKMSFSEYSQQKRSQGVITARIVMSKTAPVHKVEYLPVEKLKKHPNNPRILKDTAYQTLKQSIENNPDLLEARPLILSDRTGKLIILGGNQRYQIVKDLGWQHVPCVIFPDLTEQKEQEIMIRDNVANGEWDWDKLANEWDSGLLNEWGLDTPDWELENEPENLEEESQDIKPAKLTITFLSTDDLSNAQSKIQNIVSEFEGAYISVSAGDI